MEDVYRELFVKIVDHLKSCEVVNIFYKLDGKWILVCQSSGKHFVSDMEFLTLERGYTKLFKLTSGEIVLETTLEFVKQC